MRAILRVALVTGAASGIGAAVCRRLARPGVAILVHTRRNRVGAEQVAADVRAAGGQAEIALSDFAEPGAAGELAQSAISKFGRLSVVVANAGFADRRRPGDGLDRAGYEATHGAIAASFLELAAAAMPSLARDGNGRLIAVSAFNAHLFRPDIPAFPASAAAKAAVEVLARTLAVEFAEKGVTVNCVVPGFIRKDAAAHTALDPAQWKALEAKVPFRRLGSPEEVASVIAFLASHDASYVTGQVIHVNGGLL